MARAIGSLTEGVDICARSSIEGAQGLPEVVMCVRKLKARQKVQKVAELFRAARVRDMCGQNEVLRWRETNRTVQGDGLKKITFLLTIFHALPLAPSSAAFHTHDPNNQSDLMDLRHAG